MTFEKLQLPERMLPDIDGIQHSGRVHYLCTERLEHV